MSPYQRVSHALTPDQQTDYLTWARALRLSKFGPWEPIPETQPPSHYRNKIPEKAIFGESSTAQEQKRKPAFRKVLRGKILKFYERVLKPRVLQRDKGEDERRDEKRALAELQKEIEREEKMRRRRGDGEKGRDRERRERELRTAAQVARAVREELKRRDTGGVVVAVHG